MKSNSCSPRFARSLRAIPLLGFIVLSPMGCNGCDRRPYIPNTSEVGVVSLDATSPKVTLIDASFGVAPPNTTEWEIGGLKIASPVGSQFIAALVGDHTGDGATDAWVVLGDAVDPNKRSLAFIEKGNWSSQVALPEAAGCDGDGARRVELRSVESSEPSSAPSAGTKLRTLLLRIPLTCGIASETSLWVPPQGRPLSRAWSFSAIDPVGIEPVIELRDSDADGADELWLRLRKRSAELVYRFVKRGNEWARDLREPEESLARATTKLLAAKEAGNTLRDLEELAQSVCGSSGAIYGIQGRDSLPCLTEGSVNALRLAQGKAFLRAKDVASAALSLSRLSGKDGEKKWLTVEKVFRAELPTAEGGLARSYAPPKEGTDDVLAPVDAPWTNHEKTRFVSRVQCTRLGSFAQWYEVPRADAGPPDAASLRNVRLPLRSCANELPLQATYLGRSKAGVDLLVDGRFLTVSDENESLATVGRAKNVDTAYSACSPSGAFCVVPIALPSYAGFLVFGKTTRMLRLAAFPTPEGLRCTVNETGYSVACRLQDGTITVFDWKV
ncbi:MAG: hypothetical protein KBF88_10235 [Polyangiaceae bacterium]|nr:hypothetical protein [Polyangiaceae bacterium]